MKRNSTNFKRATRVVLVALLLGAAGLTKGFAAYDFEAEAPTGQILYFQIANTTNKLVRVTYPGTTSSWEALWGGFTKPEGDITIPTSVVNPTDNETYTVAYIGANAFYGCDGMTGALVIPNTIRTIGNYAFYGCSGFTSLTINPSGYYMSIGNRAFSGCSGFTGNLTLPYTVQTIGEYAFYNCTGFNGTLTLSSNLTTISKYAFYGCNGFTGNLAITNKVETIGDYAFYNCTGFNGTLTFGNALQTIGARAFTGYANNAWTGLNFTGSLTFPETLTSIGDYAFRNCKKFTKLTLPASLQTIGIYAFTSCTGLTGDLVIPDAVTTIGQDAFDNCVGLNGKLTIGSSVQTIGAGAFWNCNKLTGTLTIPASVTEIGGNAFALCKGFTMLISQSSTVPTAQETSFVNSNYSETQNMGTNIPVYVPSGTKSAYEQATGWNVFTNIMELKTIGTGEDTELNWSVASNWSGGELPTNTDVVYINGKVNLDTDATVSYLYFVDTEKTLAINSGKTLNVVTEIIVDDANQLTIKDGGQLKQPISGLKVTVEKQINAWNYDGNGDEKADGWYLIANPLNTNVNPTSVENMIDATTPDNYDLYNFDATASDGLEWRNYKQTAFNMKPGFSYLYGNKKGADLKFTGTVYPSINKSYNMNFTAYNEESTDQFNGWRLVGNIFVCDGYLTLVKGSEVKNADFYVMNADGDGYELSKSSVALAPCQGAFIYSEEAYDETSNPVKIKYSTEAPTTPDPVLNIALSQSQRGGSIDQARVRFGEGNHLPKLSFREDATKIYIPQFGEDYAVVRSEGEGELPVNFKAEKNGTYTLSFDMENVAFDNLRLIDNLTGVETDLLATPSYTFTAKTTDYASRFRLVFEGNNVNENVENANFAFFNGSEWVINASENATVQVVDVMGRIVVSTNGVNTVATNGLTAGVYMLRLVDGNNVKTQKIVVQ